MGWRNRGKADCCGKSEAGTCLRGDQWPALKILWSSDGAYLGSAGSLPEQAIMNHPETSANLTTPPLPGDHPAAAEQTDRSHPRVKGDMQVTVAAEPVASL